jgi:hypothetical protein
MLDYVSKPTSTIITSSPSTMGQDQDLPLDPSWPSPEAYFTSLLQFTTQHTLFLNLCGGIYIVDFLSGQPDLSHRRRAL